MPVHSPTTTLKRHVTKVTAAQRLMRDRIRQAAKAAAEARAAEVASAAASQ